MKRIKLNNRGIIVSTMLYGIITIIIIVLFALLALKKYEIEEKDNISIFYQKQLTNCYQKEVAYKKCKTNLDSSCSAINLDLLEKDYVTCLQTDFTRTIDTTNKTTVAKLQGELQAAAGTLWALMPWETPNKDGGVDYSIRVMGANPNNYVKLGNYNGRILAFDKTSSKVKIIFQGTPSQWDRGSLTANFQHAVITNENLQNVIDDIEEKHNNIFVTANTEEYYMGPIYNTTFGLAFYNEQEGLFLRESLQSFFNKISLPTIGDVIMASKNDSTCYNAVLAKTTNMNIANCLTNNFMATLYGGNYWLSTSEINTNDAYYVGNSSILKKRKIEQANANFVITFQNVYFTTASTTNKGSISNPYIINPLI